jgi:hypothetical protein
MPYPSSSYKGNLRNFTSTPIENGMLVKYDAYNFSSINGQDTFFRDTKDYGKTFTLINGATYNDSLKAIYLDGTTDYLRSDMMLGFTSQDFTLNMWFYLNSYVTNDVNQGPVMIWSGNWRASGYYMQVNVAGSVQFTTNQSGVDQTSRTADASCPLNTWMNVCITRTGSNVRIYINGVDSNTVSATHINPAPSGWAYYYLGSYFDNFYNPNGYISYFSAYERTLSAAEVYTNYISLRERYVKPSFNNINNLNNNIELKNPNYRGSKAILSAAKYPTDAAIGNTKITSTYTNSLGDLVEMLNDYEVVLASIVTEYNSATTNQKSYINKTLNGEMGYISKKLSQVQYMLNILSDEAILVQSQSVPGFTAFPNSGSRYPSGRNRY